MPSIVPSAITSRFWRQASTVSSVIGTSPRPMPAARVTIATFPDSPVSIVSSSSQSQRDHRAQRLTRDRLSRTADDELEDPREARRSDGHDVGLPILLVLQNDAGAVVADGNGRLVRNLAEMLGGKPIELLLRQLLCPADAQRLLCV